MKERVQGEERQRRGIDKNGIQGQVAANVGRSILSN